jgi:hypothetical protein
MRVFGEDGYADTNRNAIGDILKVAHEAVFISLCKVFRPRESRLR